MELNQELKKEQEASKPNHEARKYCGAFNTYQNRTAEKVIRKMLYNRAGRSDGQNNMFIKQNDYRRKRVL